MQTSCLRQMLVGPHDKAWPFLVLKLEKFIDRNLSCTWRFHQNIFFDAWKETRSKALMYPKTLPKPCRPITLWIVIVVENVVCVLWPLVICTALYVKNSTSPVLMLFAKRHEAMIEHVSVLLWHVFSLVMIQQHCCTHLDRNIYL